MTSVTAFGICVALAFSSGLCMTLSALSITYPAACAARSVRDQGAAEKICALIFNLVFQGLGAGLGILATGFGPVAIVFPVGTGTTLLSNMFLQAVLQVGARPNKKTASGTLVLACAVLLLVNIGPSDRPPDTKVDAIQLLSTLPAKIYICCSLFAIVCGLCLLRWATNNMSLLFTFATLGGACAVLNVSISKISQLPTVLHSPVLLVPLIIMYLCLACLALGVAAAANATLTDPSGFIAISGGVNLVLNCLAGICIWGDWERLEYPMSYCVVYVLVVLGTYLVSTLDIMSMDWMDAQETKLGLVTKAVHAATRRRGREALRTRSMNDLLKLGGAASLAPPCDIDGQLSPERQKRLLETILIRQLDCGCIQHEDLVRLCFQLIEEQSGGRNFMTPCMQEWLIDRGLLPVEGRLVSRRTAPSRLTSLNQSLLSLAAQS
jgi:hypothetical protein